MRRKMDTDNEARITRAMIFRKFYMEPKKTHTQLVVDYMKKYGSITALEAAEAFSCYSPRSGSGTCGRRGS